MHNSISANQVAAAKLGLDTPFASLHLIGSETSDSGHGAGLSLVWDVSGKPLRGQKGPLEAFHRLFSKDTAPIEQRKAMLAQKRSVRDTLVKNAKTLQMVGKQLTLRINGKKVVGHLAHTGDEPK